jgi:CheY-like chemotaxis protein
MMPGMNGYRLIHEIRQLAPQLPIVVASGMTGDGNPGEDRAALTAQGVRRLLNKPFVEADLLEALQAELGVRG